MADDRPTVLDELHALRAAAFDWRLSRGDVAVYAVLLQHLNFQSGESWPGATRISRIARLAVNNVKASLRRLEEHRYISVVKSGPRIANRYRILNPPKVLSRKVVKAMEEARRSLDMDTCPELDMQAGPERQHSTTPSGHARIPPSGHTGVSHLGMPACHELASELSSELSSASPSSWKQEDQQQEPRHAA